MSCMLLCKWVGPWRRSLKTGHAGRRRHTLTPAGRQTTSIVQHVKYAGLDCHRRCRRAASTGQVMSLSAASHLQAFCWRHAGGIVLGPIVQHSCSPAFGLDAPAQNSTPWIGITSLHARHWSNGSLTVFASQQCKPSVWGKATALLRACLRNPSLQAFFLNCRSSRIAVAAAEEPLLLIIYHRCHTRQQGIAGFK